MSEKVRTWYVDFKKSNVSLAFYYENSAVPILL